MLTGPLSGIPKSHGNRDGERVEPVSEITLKEERSPLDFVCEDREGSYWTRKEYQESQFDVSTGFSLLSQQLQPPTRPPQKIHSRRKSGFFLSDISLKSIIKYCKGAT